MPNENGEGDDLEDIRKTIKNKRRKAVKSCEFCRKRKLKCDQTRPQCSTCRSRGLDVCHYTVDSPNLPVLTKLATDRPDSTDKIKSKRSKEYDLSQPASHDFSLPSLKHKNTYRSSYYLKTNTDGSRIIYGPTSLQQLVFKRYPIFMNEADSNPQLHEPLSHMTSQGSFVGSRFSMNTIMNDLPSFDSLLAMINKFFHVFNKDLYPVHCIFDEQKVLNDFYSTFIPNDKNTFNNGERPILYILVDNETHCVNNYKIGVVLLIAAITSCLDILSETIHDFFTILNGTVSMKCMFIERLQFLLLQYYITSLQPSIETHQENDDYSAELINISDQLITGAVSMGLHYDIKELYKGQEKVVGNLDNLNNLRLWILLIDFGISLKMGRPLMIRATTVLDEKDDKEVSDIIVDEDGLTTYMTNGDKLENIFFNKLKRLLRVARPIINSIYEDDEIDLRDHIQYIIDFISLEFGNLESFINLEKTRQRNNFKECFLLSKVLHLLIILLALVNEGKTTEIISQSKHEILPQILIFSLRFMKTLMERASKLDKERFPEISEGQGNMPPYMASTLSVVNNLLPLVVTVFHMFIYRKASKLTILDNYTISNNVNNFEENDYVIFSHLYEILGIHCDPLAMTALKFLDLYSQIIDNWWGDNGKSLRPDLIKNRAFVSLILMEAKLRSIVEPVVNLPQIYDDAVDAMNNVHSDKITIPIEVSQINGNQKLGIMPESKVTKPIHLRLAKSIKTLQKPVKLYNSFSIGRNVNSVRHGVDPSMFQEFQVTQSNKLDKVGGSIESQSKGKITISQEQSLNA